MRLGSREYTPEFTMFSPKEIKIETTYGLGWRYATATHIPTGLVGNGRDENNLMIATKAAMKELKAKWEEHQRDEEQPENDGS